MGILTDTRSVTTVSGLRQGYGETLVIRDLDLELGRGVFGLLGPNGAGKTTLLRTLATEIRPRAGRLRLLGLDPSDARELKQIRRQLGFLPQRFGYFPGFTTREFVEYSAWLRDVPDGDVRARTQAALESVDLGGAAGRKLKTLSGGTLRRAGIAQAIVNGPRLLVLDEPTAGLDPEQRAGFRELLRRHGREGTVVVATHLVEDVAAACTQVGVMYDGRLVFLGTPDELVAQGAGQPQGDSPIERGYISVLQRARAQA